MNLYSIPFSIVMVLCQLGFNCQQKKQKSSNKQSHKLTYVGAHAATYLT